MIDDFCVTKECSEMIPNNCVVLYSVLLNILLLRENNVSSLLLYLFTEPHELLNRADASII